MCLLGAIMHQLVYKNRKIARFNEINHFHKLCRLSITIEEEKKNRLVARYRKKKHYAIHWHCMSVYVT